MAFLLLVGSSSWAADALTKSLEVTGYKAVNLFDFQNKDYDGTALSSFDDLPNLGVSAQNTVGSAYGNNNWYDDTGNNHGLRLQSGGGRWIQFTVDINKDDYIIINGGAASGTYGISMTDGESITVSEASDYLCFKATQDATTLKLTVNRYNYLLQILVMTKDESAKTANYTLNYINGELIVKSVNGEMAVGATVSTDASFFVDAAKYFRKAGEPESFTIADGENNLSVNVRPAENYNYSLVSSLGETLTSGTGLEGETVYAGYPRYQLKEGNFYEAGVTNKEYRKSLVLSQDNVSAAVDYAAWNGSNPVVFYAEGENIVGFTVSTAGNIPVRASDAKAGTAAEDVAITTLPAGKYKLHVGLFTSMNQYTDQVVNFGVGSETFAAAFTGVNLNEITSDEITVAENSDVKFIAEGSWTNAQFDYIYIEKTGDYVPVAPTYAVTIAEGIENGTVVAAPTSAKEGDEVTLTITPAEGYELASVTVTGVTSNQAIIVTDNKFTMPADAVTVNATFKQPAVTYDLTLAEGSDAHGTVAFTVGGNEAAKAKKDDVVTVSVAPAEGFVVKSVTARAYTSWENAARGANRITDAPEIVDNINVVKQEDGTWKFTMPEANVLVQVEYDAVYAINIAEGIENGTVVAAPTSAKEGDEVTLTITPAEGYELASVSVTGVTSDIAVTVTDNKFTMPADAVTVNATFQKKVIYIETDLTSKFSALTDVTKWTGASGYTSTDFCPMVTTNAGQTVQVCEKYEGTCANTGDIFYQTVTGLTPGTYKIELYGGAAFTFGRGFGSMAFTGETGTGDAWGTHVSETYQAGDKIDPSAEVSTGVTLYAKAGGVTYGGELPIFYATNFPEGAAVVAIDGVVVGDDGSVTIGMSKTSKSTNWHVVQLKGVTAQVPAADVLADAVEAAKSIAESDVPAKLYSEIQTAIETYDKEYSTADEYQTAINALNALVDKANGYVPLTAVLNEGDQYKANVPAEDPAIAAYDAAIADVKGAYDDAVVADIPAAVKVVEAALPALAKAQTAPGSDLTTLVNNTSWTCPQGNGPGKYQEIYTETYNESAYQPGKVIYQKIEGLIPGGVYEVKFLAVANTAWGKSNFGDGLAQVYANEVTSDISVIEQNNCNPTEYEQTLTAEVGDDGVFEYGMQNVAAGGNWYVVKGVSMTLKEVIISYSVDIAEGIVNGTVVVEPTSAKEGDVVTITATPAEGYELASVTVTGATSNQAVEVVTDEATGEMSFTMPADAVTVTATFAKQLQDAWIQAIADTTYSGEAIEPEIVVKDGETVLVAGTDYTVSYTDNVNPGTATVTVTAKEGSEKYSGTASASFVIKTNKSKLNAAIPEAEENYVLIKDINPKLAGDMADVIDDAKTVSGDPDATQEVIDDNTNNLLSVILAAQKELAYKRIYITIPAKSYVARIDADKRQIDADGIVAGVSIYSVNSVAGNEVELTSKISVVGAEIPYLIYNDNDEEKTISIIVSDDDADDVQYDSDHFKGTLDGKTFTEEEMKVADHYVLQNGNSFVWVKDAGTLAAGKCWIERVRVFDNTARSMRIVAEGQITGIDAASAAENGIKADGKYLKDGKIIIIKNGKEYNATGVAK